MHELHIAQRVPGSSASEVSCRVTTASSGRRFAPQLMPEPFPASVGLADRAVHVEDQLFHRAALADSIHPLAEHRHQGGEVTRIGQFLRLEPADLAGGCGGAVHGPAAHHMVHHRIDAQSFGPGAPGLTSW